MKLSYKLVAATALLCCAAVACAKEYKFNVTNSTKSAITRIQVSEDGKSWGDFNVGKGIPAGAEAQLIWDESTNSSGCEWQVKASYADGSDSEPAPFDFCEEDLSLDFSE
jgi:hypothetical protein